MTLETPLWMQGGSYSARQDRQILALIFTEGVVDPGSGGLAVTERAAGANNSVDVAAGQVVITGDDQANQGRYLCRSTATENIALTAAPGADSRIDLVVAQVNDPDAGGAAGDSWTVEVIEGVAAAAPVAPDVPDSAVPLAEVLRTNGDVAVTDAMITDRRPASGNETFSVLSNVVVFADTTERDAAAPSEGDLAWIADIDELQVYDGAAWSSVGAAAPDVQTFTASGTWTKPDGATRVQVHVVAGGGGGASEGGTNAGGGGGGGALFIEYDADDLGSTASVTVGSGGSAEGAGGASAFNGTSVPGGSGASSATGAAGGSFASDPATNGEHRIYGGGAGNEGRSVYGGGGGGRGTSSSGFAGGASTLAGDGGQGGGGVGVAGTDGEIPGGGGGGAYQSTGGAGARGQVTVVTYF